jgi:ABC-type glycerol-3-phosphate transport system substrate-binding protein
VASAILALSGVAMGTANASVHETQHAAGTVTLQFWSTYNTADKEASTMANVIIPRFEKENPGIKVNSVVLPYGVMLQKYLAAAAAGDPPDLMRSDIMWVPQLAQQGVLVKTSQLSWFSQIKKTALAGPLSTNYYKGSYYGLPDDTNTQVLFWNKTDFAAAGISSPPTTLNQLYQDAKKLTDKSKGQYGLGVDGTDVWNVAPYIWSAGGSLPTLPADFLAAVNPRVALLEPTAGGPTPQVLSELAAAHVLGVEVGRTSDLHLQTDGHGLTLAMAAGEPGVAPPASEVPPTTTGDCA